MSRIKAFFRKEDLIPSLILAAIGSAAGYALARLQWLGMTDSMKDLILQQLGSPEALYALASVQVALMGFFAALVGFKLIRRIGISRQWLPPRGAWTGIALVAAAAALIIGLSDRIFFAPHLPESALNYSFSLIYFFSSILYGGIIEEVLMRLFIMSLIVFLTAKSRGLLKPADGVADSPIPDSIFWIANVLAALLFALGHLPATAQMLGLNPALVLRSLLLNGAAGLGFGYLFWKHGLGSAMAAHMGTHLLLQLVVLPLAGIIF